MSDALALATGPADLRDQRWLDEKVAAVQDGVYALFEIAANWTEGRNLARLHPGVSAAAYVKSQIGHALGREVIVPLLEGTDWSHRQIADIAGVGHATVSRIAPGVSFETPDRLGADGKRYPVPMPRIAYAEEPVVERESADYQELLSALQAIERYAGADFRELFDALTPYQQRRARASSQRALRVLKEMHERFDADVVEVVIVEGD